MGMDKKHLSSRERERGRVRVREPRVRAREKEVPLCKVYDCVCDCDGW
jgi:hypothetical protein